MSFVGDVHDPDLWEEFWSAGNTGGGIVRTCIHDITFFHDSERAGSWEEGELEGLRANAEKDPKKYVSLDRDAYTTSIFGHEWTWQCEQCREAAKSMQNRIWMHRSTLARFINTRLVNELKRATDEVQRMSLGSHVNEQAPGWEPMTTAPLNGTEVMLKTNCGSIYPRAHFAQDLSGEEQPPFSGWFYQQGITGGGGKANWAIHGDPIGWQPIGRCQSVSPHTGEQCEQSAGHGDWHTKGATNWTTAKEEKKP